MISYVFLTGGIMVYTVAVVGATGAVGSQMLEILSSRQFPTSEVFALASERSKGEVVDFAESSLVVEDIATFDFSKADFALFQRAPMWQNTTHPSLQSINVLLLIIHLVFVTTRLSLWLYLK